MTERITESKIAELRGIAEKAASIATYPYKADTGRFPIAIWCGRVVVAEIGSGSTRTQDEPLIAEAFAAFDPPTCLSLLDELERQTKEIADYEQTDLVPRSRWIATDANFMEARQQFTDLAKRAAEEIEKRDRELVELREENKRLRKRSSLCIDEELRFKS